ncbi:MAG: mitochondrial fission ELM1 family protein [Rhodospirillaceae bacterium]|nr:mitochondrial fission ELM1 family protein [Rhodospirillaceae bacterium]
MTAGAAAGGERPLVWLIVADKLGDNAQVRLIAEALPWPCLEKKVAMREPFVLGKPKVAPSLHHLDAARSDPLEPPWPDLVITIGRRLSMVALWIQEQSKGRTKIVLVGPPKGFLDRFALVVISAQYRLPDRPNVLRLDFPLLRMDEQAIAAEGRAWAETFAPLRRPLIAVMVGGRTKAVRLGPADAAALASAVAALAAREGGSLVVTTSRRTPEAVADALAATLPKDALLHRWRPGGDRNPYRALLALADRFVVTGDSVSMLMEVARLGRPLAIYPLPPGGPAGVLLRGLAHLLPPAAHERLTTLVRAAAYRLGPVGHYRDLTAIHRLLVSRGAAVWFGQPFRNPAAPLPDELPRVVERIVGLFPGGAP